MTASGLFISWAAPAAISPMLIIALRMRRISAWRRLKTAIGLGQLLGKRAGFFANLRSAERQRPATRDRRKLLRLRAKTLGFTGRSAPHHAADAGLFGVQADPEALLVSDEPRGDRRQQPIQFVARVKHGAVAALTAGWRARAIDQRALERCRPLPSKSSTSAKSWPGMSEKAAMLVTSSAPTAV